MRGIASIFIIAAVLLTGCQESNEKEDISSVQTAKSENLAKFSDTKVGDHSKIISLVSELPGGETYKEIKLGDSSVSVVYGRKDGSNYTEEEFSDYWLNNDTIKKNLLYNSTAILILVPNADEVAIEMEGETPQTFHITREELDGYFNYPLQHYAEHEKLWEEEIVKETVLNQEERQKFFRTFPLK
ncbi:DUF4825 domain-containing protein [Fictibacillus iocasae]|uniref:DUF4825 domain-containing protein n=1 Tax=Fictibacillus iocasae TaxID=2715437 RepID=A0ABW2NQK9_9BACL